MRIRYRIIESRWPDDPEWAIRGFFYENLGTLFQELPVLSSVYFSEPRQVLRHFEQNIRVQQLSLERIEEALGDYADRYRVSPEIHAAFGDDFEGIIAGLEERLLHTTWRRKRGRRDEHGLPMAEPVPVEKEPALAIAEPREQYDVE